MAGARNASAESTSTTVTTNSIKIVGSAQMASAAAWVTNAVYAQGDYVKASDAYFMCLVAGTSTNVGTGPSGGIDVVDGTATFRPCTTRRRQGLAMYNNATNTSWTAYVSDTAPAAVGKGYRVTALGDGLVLMGRECPQGELYIILSGGSGNVSAVTW